MAYRKLSKYKFQVTANVSFEFDFATNRIVTLHFRFYFRLLPWKFFLTFEVDLSGKKWIEVDQSGFTSALSLLLGSRLKGDAVVATPRKHSGHGG